MKYMLLIYANEAHWPTMSQEQMGQAMAAYGAYTDAIAAAGIGVASERLRPTTTATSVRIVNGDSKVPTLARPARRPELKRFRTPGSNG